MADSGHSSGACCGGNKKVEQSEPRESFAKPNGDKGCGCSALAGTASDIFGPTPLSVEKADGGCCGGN